MNKKLSDFETFWQSLELLLTDVPSTELVFNQYRDSNDLVDLPAAPGIRIDNLRNYIAKVMGTATILIVGEASGPWGCRFSGIPFTGEKHLLDPSFPFRGLRSSKAAPSCPTKVFPPYTSRSAEIFWEVMMPHYDRFLVWDAFPFHPHERHDDFSVRNPTSTEVSQCGEALLLIKSYLKPNHIVAIGKKAFEELNAIGETSIYVRHPSRGGKAKFTTGIQKLFGSESKKA